IHVRQDRRRADEHDDVERRGEGERRRDDLIARADVVRQQRHVQAGGGRCERGRVAAAHIAGKLRGEALHPGTRCDPSRMQRIEELGDLGVANAGTRKRKKGVAHAGGIRGHWPWPWDVARLETTTYVRLAASVVKVVESAISRIVRRFTTTTIGSPERQRRQNSAPDQKSEGGRTPSEPSSSVKSATTMRWRSTHGRSCG